METFNQPLQQGDLDNLCSVYALLNLVFCTKKPDLSTECAKGLFDHVLGKAHAEPDGHVAKFVTKGLNPSEDQLGWLGDQIASKLGIRLTLRLEDRLSPAVPSLAYFKGTSFSHYTVILGGMEPVYPLFDSYGFTCLGCDKDRNLYSLAGNTRMRGLQVDELSLRKIWRLD